MNCQLQQNVQALVHFIEEKERLKEHHPLRYLFWESTLRCTLNCLHCGSDCFSDNATQHEELDSTLIKQELVDIAKHYDPKTITFAIIGGEPLVRRDIIDVGAFAAKLGYNWGITTNGMLLSDAKVAELKKANLKTIAVSLDGLEAHHDQLRNHKGSYKIVTAGIKRLLSDRFFEAFDIICCVNALNIDHLEPFVEELIALGVPKVRFTPIFSHGRASQHSHLMLSNEQVRKLLTFIKAYRTLPNRKIDVTLSEEGYYGPEFEGHIRDEMHYCGSGIQIGSILYDGKVTGCPSGSRNFIEGDIKNNAFIEIWNGRFERYRHGRKELFASECGTCEHWELCEGGGFHLLDQKINGATLCQYQKARS